MAKDGSRASVANRIAETLHAYGVRFVFGSLVDTGFSIFVNVLPIIIFSGCFFSVLYHLGVLQILVDLSAAVLSRLMRISGAESLAAVANLFVGMTEAALVVRPYLERMTRSELFALMTLGIISEPYPWLINEPTGMMALMMATIWMNVPVVTIVMLAGRLSVPEEYYEAAEVDGASNWQRLRHITVPQMRAFLIIAMTILSLDIARAYDIVRMMTGGGPAHRTELLWTYAGRLAIRDSQFGFAASVSMVGVAIGVLFTLILFRQMLNVRKATG